MCREPTVNDLLKLGQRFLKDDSGTTAIEYAIIGSLLSIVIVVVVNSIGTQVRARFDLVKAGFDSTN
jgi:pilus assembly protein Flp/PilA